MTIAEFEVMQERIAAAGPLVEQLAHLQRNLQDLREHTDVPVSLTATYGTPPDTWTVEFDLGTDQREAVYALIEQRIADLQQWLHHT